MPLTLKNSPFDLVIGTFQPLLSRIQKIFDRIYIVSQNPYIEICKNLLSQNRLIGVL